MILVRHAQSEFNVTYSVTRVDPGIPDPVLTGLGRDQARAAAAALEAHPVKRLITSPYSRALETTAIVAELLGLPVTVDPRVGERAAFTCDIGTRRDALAERWPALALDHLDDRWWPDFEESEDALLARCAGFRAAMAAQPDWPEVAVISHWGFIRGLTGRSVQNVEMVRCDPTDAVVAGRPVEGPALPC